MFDWNSAILGGNNLRTDVDFVDGVEAPRNSLDTVPGGSGSSDTPKSSSATKADIPFGFKILKPIIPPKGDSSDNEKRRRSPSVVARLMGLDSLPDMASATTSEQLSNDQIEKLSVAQKIRKDVKLSQVNERARTAEPRGGKEMNVPRSLQDGDVDQYNVKYHLEFSPRREEHPQEKQLQEFKKQFASKLAFQSQEHRQKRQAGSVNRDAELKQVMVQERVDEATVIADGDKDETKRLAAALEKLNKCREFQEVLEVLQSNKEFFLKFLQDPNAILLDKHLQEPVAREKTYTPPPPVEVKEPKGQSISEENYSEKKRKGGISPSAFARRFLESRREGKEFKEKPKSQQASKSQAETDEHTPITTPRTSTSLLPRFRGRSKTKSVETAREFPVGTLPENNKQNPSINTVNKIDCYSPGNIVLLRPGSTESTGICSPVSVLSISPRLSREVIESTSKCYKMVEETEEFDHQHRERIPRVEKGMYLDWDYTGPRDEMTTHAKESAKHRRKKGKKERERSKVSKDIAQDIIREARASVRELEISTAREVTLSRSGSPGRKITLLRMTSGGGDMNGNADGEVTPCSTSTTSSSVRNYHNRPTSGTRIGVLSSLSSAVSAHFSPRASKDLAYNGAIFGGQMKQRYGGKQLPPHLEDKKEQYAPGKSVLDTTNNLLQSFRLQTVSSQISSKVSRKDITGSLLEIRLLPSDPRHPQQHDNIMLPQPLEDGDGDGMGGTSQNEDSLTHSPRTLSSSFSLQRCRSIPSAGLIRDSGPYGDQAQSSMEGSNSAHCSHQFFVPESVVAGSKQFADSYKRGVEAVGSLFARAKSKERNGIFVRSRKKSHELSTSSSFNSQESECVSCLSPLNSVTTLEDCVQFDVSDATPIEWSGNLAANGSETEASDASDIKRISSASDVSLSFDREQPLTHLPRPGVEQDLLEVLSKLTFEQRVRVNPDMATDQCSVPTYSITDILEVSMGHQSSKTPKICPRSTETPRNEHDGAREMGVDKCGQPSPISVLDSPFEEESPSPLKSIEVPSDLQELRLRLHLLKLDGNDRPRHSMDSLQDLRDIELQIVNQELVKQKRGTSEDLQIISSGHSSKISTSVAIELTVPIVALDIDHSERVLLENIDLEGFPYLDNRKEDLLYVRNLLVASEFPESATKVFTRWHSPNQPLDPILFENLEDYYCNQETQRAQLVIENGCIKGSGVVDTKPRHRVLFDAVNEVLLRKLGAYLTFSPWVQPGIPFLRPIPEGRLLLLEIWMELCGCFPSSCGVDDSSFLLDRDLGKGMEWCGVPGSIEAFGLDLERAIFDDLIDETVQSLTDVHR